MTLKCRRFFDKLSHWAITEHLTRQQVKKLLEICNETLPFTLPIDPRSIFHTPKSVEIMTFNDSSQYWHHGLEYALVKTLESVNCELPNSLSLNINIDGLPIYESSNDQFWPILCNISEMSFIEPIIVGIYRGKCKYKNSHKLRF